MKSERINSELAALLAKVYVIAKKNDDFQRRTGSAFNVFNICGIDHYEMKHSAILAALLDPFGAHGLGPEFLRSFLENVAHERGCGVTQSATVRTEVSVNSADSASAGNDSRIDILIEDPESKLCVAVESKIFGSSANCRKPFCPAATHPNTAGHFGKPRCRVGTPPLPDCIRRSALQPIIP